MKQSNASLLWIECGYELFSKEGPFALKVESISKKIKVSKSSFYHHFVDTEIFIEELLNHHLFRAKELSQLAKECNTFDPEFLNLLITFKTDIFFHKQLRIHQHKSSFATCYEKANAIVLNQIGLLWATTLDEKTHSLLSQSLLNMITDIFYQRITEENYTYETIKELVNEFTTIIQRLKTQSTN